MLPSHHSGRYLIQTPAVLTSSPPSLLSGPFGLLLSAQMERDPSVTSIRAYCLYLCTKERGEKPWHCGVYWLSIKWALSDDRDVIYEAEGETLCLSYVRTSLRMKAAHTERADSRLPLSPRLGAWNGVWRTQLKRAANLWTDCPCQPIGQPWPVYLGLAVVVTVRDQWRYAEQMQKFNDKYDTLC